jgi:hypothetical protein
VAAFGLNARRRRIVQSSPPPAQSAQLQRISPLRTLREPSKSAQRGPCEGKRERCRTRPRRSSTPSTSRASRRSTSSRGRRPDANDVHAPHVASLDHPVGLGRVGQRKQRGGRDVDFVARGRFEHRSRGTGHPVGDQMRDPTRLGPINRLGLLPPADRRQSPRLSRWSSSNSKPVTPGTRELVPSVRHAGDACSW